MKWIHYVLKCSDESFYSGSTTDIDRRVYEHNQGKGAKYTRSRLPVYVVYFERYPDRSSAQKAEAAFKKLRRKQKEDFLNNHYLFNKERNESENLIGRLQEDDKKHKLS